MSTDCPNNYAMEPVCRYCGTKIKKPCPAASIARIIATEVVLTADGQAVVADWESCKRAAFEIVKTQRLTAKQGRQ
ncbi:MAG TPA: hypothetical protein VFB63_01515 [Bryobacteraceae bacterium]|nr:hypothetical protein [Bryobacteraceae bacterium]